MPLVEISMLTGRSPEMVRDLITRVHEAVQGALDVAPDHIRVIIREIPLEHWAVGGVTKAERR